MKDEELGIAVGALGCSFVRFVIHGGRSDRVSEELLSEQLKCEVLELLHLGFTRTCRSTEGGAMLEEDHLDEYGEDEEKRIAEQENVRMWASAMLV